MQRLRANLTHGLRGKTSGEQMLDQDVVYIVLHIKVSDWDCSVCSLPPQVRFTISNSHILIILSYIHP